MFRFASGDSTLNDEYRKELDALGQELVGDMAHEPALRLRITGYTDASGLKEHNEELSWKRAHVVTGYLTERFGWSQDRMTAEGRGPEDPVGSNDTQEGKALNRRVVIEVIRQADAKIVWYQGNVEYLPIGAQTWSPAREGSDLFRRYKVRTAKGARAGVRLKDGTELTLCEGTGMDIYGAVGETKEKLLDGRYNLDMDRGCIASRLAGAGSLGLRTPSADVELAAQNGFVAASEAKTLASICKGTATVSAQGKSVPLPEGFGVAVQHGKAPEEPTRLLEAPAALKVDPPAPAPGADAAYSWGESAGAAWYVIQVSPSAEFKGYALEQRVSKGAMTAALEPGDYWMRVQATDVEGLRSCFSAPLALVVRAKDAPAPAPPPPPPPPPVVEAPRPQGASFLIEAGAGLAGGDLSDDHSGAFTVPRIGLLTMMNNWRLSASGGPFIFATRAAGQRPTSSGFSALLGADYLFSGASAPSFFLGARAGVAGLPSSAAGEIVAGPAGALELGRRTPCPLGAWTLGVEGLAGSRGVVYGLMAGLELK